MAADLPRFERNRGLVRNVVLRDVKLATAPRSGSILTGYSDTRGIEDVLIESLEIEGRPITTADEAGINTQHVRKLRFQSGKP